MSNGDKESREAVAAYRASADTAVGMPVDADEKKVRMSRKKRLDNLQVSKEQNKVTRRAQENQLRILLGVSCLMFVGLQLAACDVLVFWYVLANLTADLTRILVAWMSSSLVEVIGILWVIARSLFPLRDKRRTRKAEKH